MTYPNFAKALDFLFTNSLTLRNSLALAKASGVASSTISRHASGDMIPSAEVFERIIHAIPEETFQTVLIAGYVRDCLPASLRQRIAPEIRAEVLQEEGSDDIANISRLLKEFRPEHIRDLRYLIERANVQPSILKALNATVAAMRGML
jgi:transcriptional regulator with XRE-family HTH domain